jgi:ribosomal protein S11
MKINRTKTKRKTRLRLASLHIQSFFKNTIISLTKLNGDVLRQWSTKSVKKSKSKRNVLYNLQLIFFKIFKFSKFLKIRKFNLFFKGNVSFIRRHTMKNIRYRKLKIKRISNRMLIPFNGCRIKKKKRK